MGPNRGALSFSDKARHSLRRPARKYGDETCACTAILIHRLRGSRAAPRVSSVDHGRPVSSERAIRITACLRRKESRCLESISISSGGVSACKCDGNRLIQRNGFLKELEGGRVRKAALLVRLPFGAQHESA